MEYSAPPSYIEATNRDWLPLVASCLSSTSLCNGSLVSKKWQKALSPWLWGNPAIHFGLEGDHVYVALTKFKRILPKARLQVRQHTHTLRLPAAQLDLYGRPQYQWLRNVLLWLPNLQCLVVSQISFFDHAALMALRNPPVSDEVTTVKQPPTFNLRLLIATQCNNCIPSSLGPAFLQFPRLTFLDLSYTSAAREDSVLNSIGHLQHLQILKIRRVGLRDHNLKLLADMFDPIHGRASSSRQAYRLRSLDVSDNFLTDESVDILATRLIHPDPGIHNLRLIYNHSDLREGLSQNNRRPRSSPVIDHLRDPNLDNHFIKALTQLYKGQIHLEDLDHHGLSHLYISGNSITVDGLVRLANTGNLHVLDAGNVNSAPEGLEFSFNLDLKSKSKGRISGPVHNFGKLSRVLGDDLGHTLTYSRLNHAIVTAPSGKSNQQQIQPDSVDSPSFNQSESLRVLSFESKDDTSNIADHQDTVPPYEPRGKAGWNNESENTSFDRNRSTNNKDSSSGDVPPRFRDISKLSTVGQSFDDLVPSHTGILALNGMGDDHNPRSPEAQQLIRKRQELRRRAGNEWRGLLPGHLPNLRTLVLTGIPVFSRSSQMIRALKDFISDCALEHHYAMRQAYIEKGIHIPGITNSAHTIQARAKELFALEKIVLELAPQRSGQPSEAEILPSSPTSPAATSSHSKLKTLSSVDDRDADALWQAAENDFSFFDDEKYGMAASNGSQHFSTSSRNRDTQSADHYHPDSDRGYPLSQEPLRDVVAEIAGWRSEKRIQHQTAPKGMFISGYWPGEIKIVRPDPRALQDTLYDHSKYFEEASKG